MDKVVCEFSFAPLAPTDVRPIINIFNYYVENSFAAYPEKAMPFEFFATLLKLSEGYPSVAVRDTSGIIIGFGMLRAYNPLPTFSNTAEVTYFLHPEYTRRGIGSALLEHLIAAAKLKGITTLLASISSMNEPSLAFHAKHGFVECGRFRGIGCKQGQPFDVIWMQKSLCYCDYCR